jgi:hypothetical protein
MNKLTMRRNHGPCCCSSSVLVQLKVGKPHSYTLTLLHSHTPTLPHSHTPTLPHSHTPTLPHSHTPLGSAAATRAAMLPCCHAAGHRRCRSAISTGGVPPVALHISQCHCHCMECLMSQFVCDRLHLPLSTRSIIHRLLFSSDYYPLHAADCALRH